MKKDELNKLHCALLEIMDEIDRICRLNDIVYFLDSGSALGAIRHKGFIPWDDDMDVGMTRENYNKFIEVSKQQLADSFFLQSLDTDPDYNKLHIKIRKKKSVFIERSNENRKMHQGVFVDIFPFDSIPNYGSKFIVWLNESYQRMFFRTVCIGNEYTFSIFKSFLCRVFIGKQPQNRFDKLCTMFSFKWVKGFISYSYFFNEHFVFPSDLFEDTIDIEFEDRTFMIMKKYDKYLKIMYGNYMKLPPENERIAHGMLKVDL